MQHADWASRWGQGRIGFHQSTVSALLDTYGQPVLGTGALGRVFVPLCGKSLDMVFLAERATEVVGAEFVEQAVVEFFDERGLTPTVDREPLTRYQADRYTIFATDFFDLTAEHLGPIDVVFDRASLIALNPETRIRYARHMGSLLRTGTTTLLISVDYDQQEMNGPPFAVAPEEVRELFEDDFTVEHLETGDALDDVFRGRGLTAMRESAFALTRR